MSKVTNITNQRNKLLEGINSRTAAKLILEHGLSEEAAAGLNLPLAALRQWARTPAGRDAIAELNAGITAHLDNALTGLIDKSVAVIHDRLDNGNEIRDRDGTISRVAVPLREATQALSTVFDKRQLLRKQPTHISDTDEEHIQELADVLRDLGTQKPVTVD